MGMEHLGDGGWASSSIVRAEHAPREQFAAMTATIDAVRRGPRVAALEALVPECSLERLTLSQTCLTIAATFKWYDHIDCLARERSGVFSPARPVWIASSRGLNA